MLESPSPIRGKGLRHLLVLRGFVVGDVGGLTGNGVLLVEPRAEVDELAALAAERAERVAVPLVVAAAMRTADFLRHGTQEQVARMNVTSSVDWTGRLCTLFQW